GSNRGFFHEQKLLTTFSAQFVGNISYSLYLWHWPILVFYTSNFNKSISLSHGLSLMLASIAIATISTYCIENPVRKSKWLRSRSKAVVFGSFGIMLLLTCIIMLYQHFNLSTASYSVHDSIEKQLLTIRQDKPDVYINGCHLSISATEPKLCHYGNQNSDTKVLLVGDSHAANWIPAIEEIAIRNNWKFSSMTKSGCPYSTVPTKIQGKPYPACDEWNKNAEKIIADYSPDIFIISQKNRHRSIPGGSQKNYPLYANSAIDIMQHQVDAGVRVFAIATTPVMKEDIPECLSRHPKNPGQCATSRELIASRFTLIDPLITAANAVKGATIIHPLQLLCNDDTCPAVSNGKIIWRDSNHLTATFSRSLADDIEEILKNKKAKPASNR
ncbi:MAG TPA: acyltransferase family protein, partial [Cellvibrionaceae bacterium]